MVFGSSRLPRGLQERAAAAPGAWRFAWGSREEQGPSAWRRQVIAIYVVLTGCPGTPSRETTSGGHVFAEEALLEVKLLFLWLPGLGLGSAPRLASPSVRCSAF